MCIRDSIGVQQPHRALEPIAARVRYVEQWTLHFLSRSSFDMRRIPNEDLNVRWRQMSVVYMNIAKSYIPAMNEHLALVLG